MRLTIAKIQDGKRQVVWPMFFLFVVACYATSIGSAEVFWKLFSGNYSSLIGLLALFVGTLIVVRTVGEAFALPAHVDENWLKEHDGL